MKCCNKEMIFGNKGWAYCPVWHCEICEKDIQITDEKELEKLHSLSKK